MTPQEMKQNNWLQDETDGQLISRMEDDLKNGDNSLLICVQRRMKMAEQYGRRVIINIGIPNYAFYFVHLDKNDKFVLNGGIIYHGSHDGGGNGGAPTFSVCLTPTRGWSTHT